MSRWIVGMADVHNYQVERGAPALSLVRSDTSQLSFKLSFLTELELHDQPLSIQVAIPKSWPSDRIVVTDGQSKTVAFPTVQGSGQIRLRFDLAPRTEAYRNQMESVCSSIAA